MSRFPSQPGASPHPNFSQELTVILEVAAILEGTPFLNEFLNIGLAFLVGEAGGEFASFLFKSITANNKNDLDSAAKNLAKFLETVVPIIGGAALIELFDQIGEALRIISGNRRLVGEGGGLGEQEIQREFKQAAGNNNEQISRITGGSSGGGLPVIFDNVVSGTRVIVRGYPETAAELPQAVDLVRLEGGGTADFLGNAQQGIEGFITPLGSTERIPFSLKDFSKTDASNLPNIIRRINNNATKIVDKGFSDVILRVEIRQVDSTEALNFIKNGPIINFPSEAAFEKLYFVASDGTVLVDSSGARII